VFNFSWLKRMLDDLGFSDADRKLLKDTLSQGRKANEQFTITCPSIDSRIANSILTDGCVISNEGFQLLTKNTDLKRARPLVIEPDTTTRSRPPGRTNGALTRTG